jgi:hypothetical protein
MRTARHYLSLLDTLAEQRIAEAATRGEFDDLPGAGAPLELEDDALIPEELRAAYRLLKNSGYLPPDLEYCRELRDIETLLLQAETGEMRSSLLARMGWLLARSSAGRQPHNLHIDDDYFIKLADRMALLKTGKA